VPVIVPVVVMNERPSNTVAALKKLLDEEVDGLAALDEPVMALSCVESALCGLNISINAQ